MKDSRTLSAAFFFPAALTLAASAAAAPIIENVSANGSLTTVTINGEDLLGKKARSVFLSGFGTPLTVTSWTDTQIVAALPAGLASGSYSLIIQGQGGNDLDEFFATFTAAAGGGGGGTPCTSYSNSSSSTTFSATLSVNTPGNYALSAKLVVNSFAPGGASFSCSLGQSSGGSITNLDQTFVAGSGELNVILQATTTVPGPAQYFAGCSGVPGGTTSYFNWKIQAICLPALVSPSP